MLSGCVKVYAFLVTCVLAEYVICGIEHNREQAGEVSINAGVEQKSLTDIGCMPTTTVSLRAPVWIVL